MRSKNVNLLTPCQRQVFEFVAWGETYKEIADRLHKSVHTVINLARGGCERLGIYPSQIPSWWFCVNFGISFDLSPVKRKAGATLLMALFLIMLIHPEDMYRRGRRGRRAREYEWIIEPENE